MTTKFTPFGNLWDPIPGTTTFLEQSSSENSTASPDAAIRDTLIHSASYEHKQYVKPQGPLKKLYKARNFIGPTYKQPYNALM